MTTCNNVILAQPNAEQNISYTIPEGDSARLNFGPEDITGLQLGANGELIISFEDGGQLTIDNFSELSDAESLVYLADGTLIDPAILTSSLQTPDALNNIETAAGDLSGINTNIIAQPGPNTRQELSMASGQKYICDFDPANAATVELKDGQMVLTFADGSQVVIDNYAQAMAGELPPELTLADGSTVDAETLQMTEVTEVAQPIEEILQTEQSDVEEIAETLEVAQESVVADVASIEPAAGDDLAALADQLANIETAAGDEGGGPASAGGYGFNSTATDVPLNSPDAIGPLGATQLAYDAPEGQNETFLSPIRDDAPIISSAIVEVDDSDLDNGDNTATGTINVDYGNGSPGTITTTNIITFSCGATSVESLSSEGLPVTVTNTANGYVGSTVNGDVFTFTINATTGEFEFTQLAPLDHPDTTDPNDELCINLGIRATDSDGDARISNVRVIVRDDGPEILEQTDALVDETNFDNGVLSTTGQFAADVGEDVVGATYTGSNNFSFDQTDALTSNGETITVTFDADTNAYTGATVSGTVFTMVMDPATGEYTYTQIAAIDHPDGSDTNEPIDLNFGITVTDGDGDSVSADLTVTVLDDAPQANDDNLGTIDHTETVSGNVIDNDDGGADGISSVTSVTFNGETIPVQAGVETVIQGDYGVLTIAADGTYTYDPVGDNDGGTDVFTYEIVDGDGDTSSANLTIQVSPDLAPIAINGVGETDDTNLLDGTNDVENGVINVNYQGEGPGTTSGNGDFGSAGNRTDNTLTSNGVAVTVSFDAATNTYTGMAGDLTAFTMVIHDDGTYTFTQVEPLDHSNTDADNEALFLDFGVNATDSDGDVGTGTVRITVRDDAPDANDDSQTVNPDTGEADGNVVTGLNGGTDAADTTAEGSTVTSIQFGEDTIDVPATGTVTIDGDHGQLTISADGTYTYVLNEGATETVITTGSFDPSSADVVGTQNSITENGITISANNGQDLSWFTDNVLGSGVGITGNGTTKVYGANEMLEISLAEGADSVQVTLGDIGTNNVGNTFSFTVHLADGSTVEETVTIDGGNVSNGLFTFDVDGYDSDITSIDLVGGPSYVLNGVQATYVDAQTVQDDFIYTITDSDGDTDTATLKLVAEPSDDVNPIDINGVGQTDDTNLLDDGMDMITGTINVNYQGDEAGSTSGNGAFNTSGNLANNTLSHDGAAIEVSFNAQNNTYTGVAGNVTVFTMVINENGTYKFTQLEAVDHSDANDSNEALFLEFGVTATDGDGDTGNGTVTITVRDDAPLAENDSVSLSKDDNTKDGNVLSNDNAGADDADVMVCDVTFGGRTVDVPTTGSVTITNEAGTLTISSDGSYTYERPYELVTTGNNTAKVYDKDGGTFAFDYTMKDGDGDTSVATLTVTVEDNLSPIDINGVGATDDTDLLDDGLDVVTGTINVNYQGDIPGQTTGNGAFGTAGNVAGNTLSSNGVAILVSFDAASNTYTGMAGTETAFTMVINTDGTYTFTQSAPLDHSNENANNEALFLDFGVTATDSDGDSGTGTVRITVLDDAPEAQDDTASTSVTSTSEEHCFDPTEADVAGTQNSITQDGITLTSNNGADLVWVQHEGPGVGIAGEGTDKVFRSAESLELRFDHNADAVELKIGDMGANNIGNTFKYTVYLADGTSVEETVTIDADMVSNAVFTFDVNGYSSDITGIDLVGGPSFLLNGVKTEHSEFETVNAEGNVLANDDLSADASTLVTSINVDGQDYAVTASGTTIQTANGILTITANGQYSYEATGEEDSTNVFVYTITDGDGDTSVAQLSITSDGICTIDHAMEAPKFNVNIESFDNNNPDRDEWDFSDTYNVKYHGSEQSFDFTIDVTSGEENLDFFLIEIPDILSEFGVELNKGSEVSDGVWKVDAADTTGLQITLPGLEPVDGKTWRNPDYRIPQGKHDFEVTAQTIASEEVCNHGEVVTVEANIEVIIFSSPLVLDLDGDGIELLNIDQGVEFDMDQDGEVEQTGWVGADDGLLVLDKNDDGIINDRSELFGDTDGFSDGFDNLSSYDSNSDGVIDANDEIYSDLKVWQDANSDGISGSDEMLSLLEVGVVSIFLNADMPEDLVIEGNPISHTSTFLTDTGETHEIVDAWFGTAEINDTLTSAIEESASTLLAIGDAGEDVLDISQMLETGDDITEAIADFVHHNDDGVAQISDTNVEQSEGLAANTNDLGPLDQSLTDQVII